MTFEELVAINFPKIICTYYSQIALRIDVKVRDRKPKLTQFGFCAAIFSLGVDVPDMLFFMEVDFLSEELRS